MTAERLAELETLLKNSKMTGETEVPIEQALELLHALIAERKGGE